MTVMRRPSAGRARLAHELGAFARFLRATELDTRMLGMVGALVDHLDRLPHPFGRAVPDAAQSVEPVGADLLGRDHGDRHGAGHRHPQHRPVGRLDPRRRSAWSWASCRPIPAGQLARPRQSGDLDHRARCRPRASALLIGALPGRHHRLSRRAGLHRHAGRLSGLARRRLVGDQGPDRRAAGRDLPADGRRPARLDRRDLELGRRRASPASPSCSGSYNGRRQRQRFSFPAAADLGRSLSSASSAAASSSARLDRQCLSLADRHRCSTMPRPTTSPCPKAACSSRTASPFRC